MVLITLMVVVAAAAALVIGAQIASDSLIKPLVASRVEEDLSRNVRTIVGRELATAPIQSDQPREVLVTEVELNQRIDEQSDLGPLDRARAEITSEGIALHLRAYGLSGVYRARVSVSGGAATIHNGTVSGPLGFVIPVEDLERTANEAIAASLNDAGMRVTQVTLADGAMVLTLEPTGAANA